MIASVIAGRTRGAALLSALLSCVACAACGKGTATAKAPAASSSSWVPPDSSVAQAVDAGAVDPRATDLWTHAKDGDADDLARLARYVGSEALEEASARPGDRMTALGALAFVDDFTVLPFLAKVASGGSDAGVTEDAALAALASITTLAAEPRRATDPEDALEVAEGCATLLAFAKDTTRPAPRRARAVSALRLLADRGWVVASSIPTDIDAH